MAYTDILTKLRVLAQQNAALQTDLAATQPLPAVPFRWFDRQLQPGNVANNVGAGTCVAAMRVSTVRQTNMGGIMNLELARVQVTVYDMDSVKAANVANDVVEFMRTISLCSLGQFQSPYLAPNQNPNFLLNQRQGMVPNPQSPSGPIYTEVLEFRCYNRTDLAIS
jgi:hypothetical protein